MAQYLYDDEDNEPMMDDTDRVMKYTTYMSRAEEKAEEMAKNAWTLPFDDSPRVSGCWNCMLFDPTKDACTKDWNNMDESYYNPDRDDRDPSDSCDDWEEDPDAEV